MYLYQAFGVTIGSEIALPELLPVTEAAPDVRVVRGKVEPLSFAQEGDRKWFRGSAGCLQFDVDGVARFLVTGGSRIVFESEAGVAEEDVRLFLLGSGLGAMLMQRGLLVLHGSTVLIGGRAVSFLGESGAGKSTLSAALRKKGFPLLGDDLCVVSGEGELLVQSGYPQNKLWEDSLRYLEVDPEGLKRVRQSMDKRALPIERGLFCDRATPLGQVYVLERSKGGELELEGLLGGVKLASLLVCRYRPQFVLEMGLERQQFDLLGRIAREVPLAVLARPEGRIVIDELVSRVLSELENENEIG